MSTRYRGTQDEVRALSALITVMRASEALVASLQRELAGKGLTASQFGILDVLLHIGPICQGELAGKLLRSGGSVTSVVSGLEKRGLVARRRDGSDKRYVTVSLTEKGRKAIGGLFPEHARTVARQFAALTAPEQDELRRLCRKLGRSVSAA
ncbi:MAG: MarR family transcriptional regulator [Elusimicrobia bacterium]|nr:MarR family transcriptional regulator [Elusimicrobiota bacterium]